MEHRRIIKDGSNLLFGSIGTSAIGLLNLIILTRILTTEEMGKYSLFLMVVNLALMVGLTWSDSSIIRHGREEFVKSGKINKSFTARLYLVLPMVVLFTILFILFSRQLIGYIGIESYWAVAMVIGVFILNGAANALINVYRSIDQMRKSAYILFFQKLVYLALLFLVLFKAITPSLMSVLVVMNVSFAITLLWNMLTFDTKVITPMKYDKKQLRKLWTWSWPQLIGFPAIYIVNYIDLYVIRTYLTLSDVGVYNIAYTGFSVLTGLLMIIHNVAMPLIVEYRAKRKYGMIRSYASKIPLMAVAWAVVAVLMVLSASSIVNLLFSHTYAGAVPSFKVLLLATIFSVLSISILPFINAFDLVIYIQASNIVVAVANAALDFALIPQMGIIGAAYATLISFAIGFIINLSTILYHKRRIFGA